MGHRLPVTALALSARRPFGPARFTSGLDNADNNIDNYDNSDNPHHFSLIFTIIKLPFFSSVSNQFVANKVKFFLIHISIFFFLKAMEIDQLSIMSKLSRSLVIDRSHDEANTISSSASKIDGLFVSLQLELNIRQPTTK